MFWNQKLITKSLRKSAKNVIRNLYRSRKYSSEYSRVHLYRVQTKISIENGSILFQGRGSVGAISLNLTISWQLSLVSKSSVWMIQMTTNLHKRKILIGILEILAKILISNVIVTWWWRHQVIFLYIRQKDARKTSWRKQKICVL